MSAEEAGSSRYGVCLFVFFPLLTRKHHIRLQGGLLEKSALIVLIKHISRGTFYTFIRKFGTKISSGMI